MRTTAIAVSLSGLLLVGCAADEEATPLDLDQSDDAQLVGAMQVEDLEVVFSSRQVEDQVFAIEVRYGDVTFTGEFDYVNELFHLDGFVTSTGADIAIEDLDMVIIQELGQALSDAGLVNSYRPDVQNLRGVVYQTPGSVLSRMLSVWALSGVGVSPEREIKAVHGRTINYYCGYLTGMGVGATHDCWDCWDTWDGWNYVDIGPGTDINCYPDSCDYRCWNYNVNYCGRLSCEQSGGGGNGTWQWGSYGDKYGACTIWDSNSYTGDCLRHDHCVRNDHSTGSSWCSDDAVPAGDDQTSGRDCIMANGCGGACGTYSAAGCWCDSSCDSYGDCCMDKHAVCG